MLRFLPVRRYLTPSEAKLALDRGKQIEQFLGGYLAEGEPAIRYVVVRSDGERIVGTVYECLEPLNDNFYDVVEFHNVEPDTDPEDFCFDTLEEAFSFLKYRNGVTENGFVNQGMICEEYKDFRLAKKK
jgi:hypothetical protein